MTEAILAAAAAELSSLSDLGQLTRAGVRLFFAALLGALIGIERELRDSPAGLRTHMLVALGCALFVLVPQQAGVAQAELTRVVQGVAAGVGFLGAGAVLKSKGDHEIRGLTTAASVWATAAIGVTVGLGHEATAILAALLVLFILAVLFRWERWMERRRSGSPAP